MTPIKSISIIGSGNVAWHLAFAFKNTEITIQQIFGRNLSATKELAESMHVDYCSKVEDLKPADAFIFAITDSAFEAVLKEFNWNNALLIHVAGSIDSNVFENYSSRYGVMYPLQSFTKKSPIDISKVPFLIEGNNDESLEQIKGIASLMSSNMSVVDSQQRLKIHLAAVFASNYLNYMLTLAEQLLNKENIDISILRPLVDETIKKAFILGPYEAQTGPARRHNFNIIQKHEELLKENQDWQLLYSFLANSIAKTYSKE